MDVAVLIPYRPDHGHRDRLYRHVMQAWRSQRQPVFVGVHDGPGPFSAARAFNAAFALAQERGFDGVALFGADHLPDTRVMRDVEGMLDDYPWLSIYGRTGVYSQLATDAILGGANPRHWPLEQVVNGCTGILAVRTHVWNDVRGMDERFQGWGFEDTAFRLALRTIYGREPSPPGDVLRSLWHPSAAYDPVLTERNRALYDLEYVPAAQRGRNWMRALCHRANELPRPV